MKSFAPIIGLLAGLTVSVSASIDPYHKGVRGLVDSDQLRRRISRRALYAHAVKLQEFSDETPAKSRVASSLSHNMTNDYIYSTLVNTGYYDVELQPFEFIYAIENSSFTAGGHDIVTEYMHYSPAGKVEAPLVAVDHWGCESYDFPEDVSGYIALILRGTCEFGLKVALAGAAGAIGVIFYNDIPGEDFRRATLMPDDRPEGKYVPALGITYEDGFDLVYQLGNGTSINATMEITIETPSEIRYTNNVIATSKSGNQSNIIMSGAGTDSVAKSPGINDNGSGSMALLEIALQLTKFSVINTVRFGFWSVSVAESFGSLWYCDVVGPEELYNISLYLDFDMIASPNFGIFVSDGDGSTFNTTGPPGSDHIEHVFGDYFNQVGIRSAPSPLGGDQWPFLLSDIPTGGLFGGAGEPKSEEQVKWWGGKAGTAFDPNNSNAPGDDITNLSMGGWIENTKAAAHAIATYAISTTGIPRRAWQQKRSSPVHEAKTKVWAGEAAEM